MRVFYNSIMTFMNSLFAFRYRFKRRPRRALFARLLVDSRRAPLPLGAIDLIRRAAAARSVVVNGEAAPRASNRAAKRLRMAVVAEVGRCKDDETVSHLAKAAIQSCWQRCIGEPDVDVCWKGAGDRIQRENIHGWALHLAAGFSLAVLRMADRDKAD